MVSTKSVTRFSSDPPIGFREFGLSSCTGVPHLLSSMLSNLVIRLDEFHGRSNVLIPLPSQEIETWQDGDDNIKEL